jgi:hypothetical protein
MKGSSLSLNSIIFLYLFLLVLLFSGTARAQEISPNAEPEKRKSAAEEQKPPVEPDGCTGWFDGGGLRDCCIQHDKAYLQGVNWRTRLQADNQLFMCVAKKGFGQALVAPAMWIAVRIFGSSWFPSKKKRPSLKKREKVTEKSLPISESAR